MSYILLIEDDQHSADMVTHLLKDLDVEVRHSLRGLEGAKLARRDRPDLILMDFNLPDIDGRTLVLQLKKQLGGQSSPPIVALTARAGATEMYLAEKFGCSAFVSKPFEPEAFLNVIKSLVPRLAKTPDSNKSSN
jgi:DNA-binding response OmpR family regulator